MLDFKGEKMLDAIGQTIKIGDIVAASSNSSFYGNHGICVVTRFGNNENLQINGNSFVDHKSVIVITSQYQLSFGVFKASEVIEEHKDKFDYTLPEVKVSKRYVVLRIGTYKESVPAKYYVVATTANNQQMYKDLRIVIDKFMKDFNLEYVKTNTLAMKTSYRPSREKSPVFGYDSVDQPLKFIKEHNLEAFIDSEITSPEVLEKLASYEVR